MVDDVVEEIAFVADDDDRRLVVHEEILEPHHRFEIEVVRRFVEQQQVGLREEERGERDAHLPAAREAVERALLHLFVEAEAEQDLRGAHRGGIGVDRDQALVDVAEPVGVFAVSDSIISAARSTSAARTVSNGVAVPEGASCAI